MSKKSSNSFIVISMLVIACLAITYFISYSQAEDRLLELRFDNIENNNLYQVVYTKTAKTNDQICFLYNNIPACTINQSTSTVSFADEVLQSFCLLGYNGPVTVMSEGVVYNDGERYYSQKIGINLTEETDIVLLTNRIWDAGFIAELQEEDRLVVTARKTVSLSTLKNTIADLKEMGYDASVECVKAISE